MTAAPRSRSGRERRASGPRRIEPAIGNATTHRCRDRCPSSARASTHFDTSAMSASDRRAPNVQAGLGAHASPKPGIWFLPIVTIRRINVVGRERGPIEPSCRGRQRCRRPRGRRRTSPRRELHRLPLLVAATAWTASAPVMRWRIDALPCVQCSCVAEVRARTPSRRPKRCTAVACVKKRSDDVIYNS